jgi:glucose/arabinose dehydrogenase
MKFKVKYIFILSILVLSLGCKKEKTNSTEELLVEPTIELETIISNYEIIWGMDFLPNGDLIFGEKRGRLYLKKPNVNQIIEITGLPAINASGQGGLLDIKVDPSYKTNGWIYITYTNSSPSYNLKFSKFKIVNDKVSDLQPIFTVTGPGGHNGSRILFDKKGFIYLCVGEGPSTGGGRSNTNKNSSDPKSSWGKIHRFNIDGSIPSTNPIIIGNTTFNSIFSIGHRNPQGLALHPSTGDVWESEHGPLGGDEINIISSNGHYGWPAVSLGKNYDGSIISQNHDSVGITKPIYAWTPSIGICGITFITGKKFKAWSGNLIVSGLASQKLYRCIVKDNKIIQEEIILTNSGRVRNVIQGPDESLYVSVEGPGRIIRIIPK